MKSETFVNGNKKITYSEGFAEIYKFADNDFHIPNERICEICVVQLENAYLFWSFCRVTTAILHRKYSKAVVMVKIDDKNESSDNVNESSNEPTNNQESTSTPGIGSDYTCKICNKSFPNRLYLKRHRRNVRCVENTELNQTIKPYKCKRCNREFARNSDLRRHIRNVRCMNANSKNQTINDDGRHIREVHVSNKKYKCSLCSCGYTRQTRLVRHTKMKHPAAIEDIQKQYKCVLCATGYARSDGLFHHNRTKHPNLVKEQCEFCKQVFSSKHSLAEHDRSVHFSDGYECELCLKVFQQKTTFFWHKRKVHPNACKICKMEFNCSTDLIVHNETHPKIHECSECEQSFTHLKDLNEHARSTHFENIHFTCDICGKKLQSHLSIEPHMLLFHLNIGYKCKLCPQKYIKKQQLWAHAFKHRELQPFNCDNDCSYRTAHKSEFKMHLSRKHKVEYNESVHGYKLETFEEVIAFVQ
jgi:KRAB domain-containing zinc finger protein